MYSVKDYHLLELTALSGALPVKIYENKEIMDPELNPITKPHIAASAIPYNYYD